VSQAQAEQNRQDNDSENDEMWVMDNEVREQLFHDLSGQQQARKYQLQPVDWVSQCSFLLAIAEVAEQKCVSQE
jgi:hypothetical protein